MDAPLRFCFKSSRRNASYRSQNFDYYLSVRRYLSGKDFFTQMKNTSKRFSESIRKYFRDGIALYAMATAGYPEILSYLKQARELRGEE